MNEICNSQVVVQMYSRLLTCALFLEVPLPVHVMFLLSYGRLRQSAHSAYLSSIHVTTAWVTVVIPPQFSVMFNTILVSNCYSSVILFGNNNVPSLESVTKLYTSSHFILRLLAHSAQNTHPRMCHCFKELTIERNALLCSVYMANKNFI